MKNLVLVALFLAIGSFSFASNFECQTYLNLEAISAQVVQTEPKVKVPVDETDVAVSFLTEKHNNIYSLEVFLPYSDMRIYSEAQVAEVGQSITASVWARQYMIDVVCRKLN